MHNEMPVTPIVPKSRMRLEAEQRFSRSLVLMFNQMQPGPARKMPRAGEPEPGTQGSSRAA